MTFAHLKIVALVSVVSFAASGTPPVWATNSKSVNPIGSGPLGVVELQDTLHYKIEFQNVSGGTVNDAIIIDTLDPDLDTLTLEILPGSHPFVFSRDGYELTWTYQGLLLPDSATDEIGSHGTAEYTVLFMHLPFEVVQAT